MSTIEPPKEIMLRTRLKGYYSVVQASAVYSALNDLFPHLTFDVIHEDNGDDLPHIVILVYRVDAFLQEEAGLRIKGLLNEFGRK